VTTIYPVQPEENTLSTIESKLLHEQVISQTSPGTIINDFQMLLDFIGIKGIEVSKTQNFLPMSSLAELNSRLTNPIQVELNRPQQKAYPHLHGLYLLLRASTLSYIEPKGKKFFLYLEPKVLESWHNLNLTERYFNLLEAWLIWGNEEILNEKGWRSGFEKCFTFWHELASIKKFVIQKEQISWYSYSPGLYQIALLEMFGMLEIEHAKPKKGQGWQFTQLKQKPWGNALVKLIKKTIAEELASQIEEKDPESEEYPFGIWQPQLQVFFPEWQNNIIIPEPKQQEGIYVFKVSLGQIWRRIAIPDDYNLYDLSRIILESVNFDDDHLHEFSYKSRYGWTVQVNHPSNHEPPFTNEFLIADLSLSLKVGQTMTYLFDYGDNWTFNILLERIESDNSEIDEPTILDSYGSSPEQYPSWDDEEDEE
jgi:hypothetical protein